MRRYRRRNLALGLGILSLLGATVVLLVVGSRRAQDLARQRLDLVAGISHDLRTPVASISSLAENLRDGVVAGPEEVRRYGEALGRESRRLRDLVEQGLALAGLESVGRGEVRRLDLEALLREAVASVRGSDDPEVRLEVAPDLEAFGDPGLLGRAVGNLVSNALRHGGGSAVEVRVEPGPDDAEVRIVVEDRGPGLPDEPERLFEAFARGEASRRRGVPGSGLGLTVVRRVAQVHGGSVGAENRPEGGARFVLGWPGRRR